jgi:hypothetical protein
MTWGVLGLANHGTAISRHPNGRRSVFLFQSPRGDKPKPMETQQRRAGGSNAAEWEKKQSPSSSSHSIQSSQSTADSYVALSWRCADQASRDVMFKLLAFTAAMVILPLGTYWFSLNYVFAGMLAR